MRFRHISASVRAVIYRLHFKPGTTPARGDWLPGVTLGSLYDYYREELRLLRGPATRSSPDGGIFRAVRTSLQRRLD
jgi:hypothetical protein